MDWWGVDGRKWKILTEQVLEPNPKYAELAELAPSLESSRDRAIVEWIVTMRKGAEILAEDPDAMLTVRFEDLCQSPSSALERIVDYCELPPDPGMLRYAEDVLKPLPARDRFDVHPVLRPLFLETLDLLGYQGA